MKKIMSVLTILSLAFLVIHCAHHRDVRPGASGVHKVVTRAADKGAAEKDAISQARHFCKEQKLSIGIVEEKTTYEGDMDEETRGVLRRASKTASILGGWDTSGDGSMSRNPIGTAGDAGVMMTEDDAYVTQMSFKCQ